MMKRLAAIAAMSLVAFQAVSGVAVGATAHLGSGLAPVANGTTDGCAAAAVLGTVNVNSDEDITFSIDSDAGKLECDAKGNNDGSYDLEDVDKVLVYGNRSTEHGNSDKAVSVTFDLNDEAAQSDDLADFNGIAFTVRVEGNVVVDGTGVDDRDDFDVELENGAFSVGDADLDVTITYAKTYDVTGGDGDDTIDGKKVTAVGFMAAGGDGDDVIYGGGDGDTLNCGDDNGAYHLDGSGDPDGFVDQCWGGDGDDDITIDEDVVAPGDGDDDVSGYALAVTYVDSSASVIISADTDSAETESDAGDDDFDSFVESWTGSAKADKFYGSDDADSFIGGNGADVAYGGDGNDSLSGGAGNDRMWGGAGNDVMRGGSGDDVLKGNAGTDKLRGDSGSDQAWGGKGKDACGAEVTDSCEFTRI